MAVVLELDGGALMALERAGCVPDGRRGGRCGRRRPGA